MSAGVRATLIFTHGDSGSLVATTSYSVRNPGLTDPDQAGVDEVRDKTKEWWDVGLSGGAAMKTKFGSWVKLVGVHAETQGGSGAPLTSDWSGSIAGTYAGGGDQSDPENVLLVNFVTASTHAGPTRPHVRTSGRMFLPPPPATEVSANGILDPTYGAAVEAVAEELRSFWDGVAPVHDMTLSVYRRAANVYADVTNVRIRKGLADLRRRRVKRPGYIG